MKKIEIAKEIAFKRLKIDVETALNNPHALVEKTKELFEAHTLNGNYDQKKVFNRRVFIHLLTRRELQVAFCAPCAKKQNFKSLFGRTDLADTVKTRSLLRLDTYIISFFRIMEHNFEA